MQATITIVVMNCWDCPYRETDRDGDTYCSNDEAADGFHEYQLHAQNRETLTESCPLIQEQT